MTSNGSSDKTPAENPIQRLQKVRAMLLHLHKALLESERIVYEQTHGRIANRGEFFRLVIGHEDFSWLRPISQFIVQIDELLDEKDTIEPDSAAILLEKARLMLKPNEHASTPLGEHYFYAIQRDPNIALLHAEISQVLRQRPQ